MIEEYSIDIMFTAPTALRAIRRDDPENKHLKRIGARGGLRSLKALFLAGERSEPSIVTLYQELLEKYGARGAHVIDNWWSSESGSPITGIALSPLAGRDRGYIMRESRATSSSKAQDSGDGGAEEVSRSPLAKVKPGSAGKAMPGFDVRVVDDSGKEVKRGVMGNIVLALPLAPTAFRRLWDDEERFFRGYLKRFGGRWVDTGDAGFIDEDGYVHVMSRAVSLSLYSLIFSFRSVRALFLASRFYSFSFFFFFFKSPTKKQEKERGANRENQQTRTTSSTSRLTVSPPLPSNRPSPATP